MSKNIDLTGYALWIIFEQLRLKIDYLLIYIHQYKYI